MARVRSILGALWKAAARSRRSLGSFSGNNMYYAGFTLLFFSDPIAFIFFLVIIGLVLFFPFSSDPLRAIPPDRLSLWPLTNRDRRWLRILSPWLNPLTWLLAVLLVWKRITLSLWALILGLFGLGFITPSLHVGNRGSILRRLPNLPGPLNHLIRKNLRELGSTLDFYAGLVVAVPALLFRLSGKMPADAFLPLTLVIMLIISTTAQSLLGLDGAGGLTRYHLLPIPGWQILLAKDVAFLFIALLFTLPLSPLGGFAAALMALAVGHRASVADIRAQARWRFQTSGSFGAGLVQMILMIFAAAGCTRSTPFILIPCAAAYGWSTWWFGRVLEEQREF